MAKRRSRILPKGLTKEMITNANPSKGAAEFAFPRTAEDGISLANLGLDIGDWYAPATTYATEVATGREEFNPLIAGLFGLPIFGGLFKKARTIPRAIEGVTEFNTNASKFIRVPKGNSSLNGIISAANSSGIKITPQIEKEIRGYIGIKPKINGMPTPSQMKAAQSANKYYDKMSPEAKMVIDAYYYMKDYPHKVIKPTGFNSLSPQERINYLEEEYKKLHQDPEDILSTTMDSHSNNYGDYDMGFVMDDYLTPDDYLLARRDLERELGQQYADAQKVQSLDKFEDKSSGIIHQEPNPDPIATGATKKSYDHSRPFNGGNFQKLEPIDRQTLMKDDYDLGQRMYDAQSDFTGVGSINEGRDQRAAKLKYPRNYEQDPYYSAGVINDKNSRLNALIDRERKNGMSDSEIYKKYKDEFDSYQGDIERFKTRIANSENPSKLTIDGASTNAIRATASEKIDVMRKLGIDPNNPRTEEILDKYMQFYDDLQKRYLGIPGTPREDMFGRLLDMDYYDKLKQLKK